MHSSRMRTVRCSGRPGGGGEVFQVEYVSACLPRGVSAQAGGGAERVSARHPLWTE